MITSSSIASLGKSAESEAGPAGHPGRVEVGSSDSVAEHTFGHPVPVAAAVAGSSSGADGAGGAQASGPGADQTPTARGIPPKLYRIGELVDYCGVSRQTIHNYTIMGLLRETRWSQGGHRLYDEWVFGRLDHILEMKGRNKSMREIRDFFRELDE